MNLALFGQNGQNAMPNVSRQEKDQNMNQKYEIAKGSASKLQRTISTKLSRCVSWMTIDEEEMPKPECTRSGQRKFLRVHHVPYMAQDTLVTIDNTVVHSLCFAQNIFQNDHFSGQNLPPYNSFIMKLS